MWTRLLNRLSLAAILIPAGAFGAVLARVVKHQRRAPPLAAAIAFAATPAWCVWQRRRVFPSLGRQRRPG